jgi:DNA-binding response OmpR family regulator
MKRVLVVDDDPGISDVLGMYMKREGYEVTQVVSGEDALVDVERDAPALVLLDIMLPGIDGYEVCRRIRAAHDVPIIFLTCKDDDIDTIVGLEIGADDYITKPFNPREVVARARAVLRRSRPPGEGEPSDKPVVVGGLAVDDRRREVRVRGESVKLTPKEFDVLLLLASHPRVVFSRNEIMQHVWGYDFDYGDTRTVDTHVKRIRRKLSDAGCSCCAIESIWGTGYRLVQKD